MRALVVTFLVGCTFHSASPDGGRSDGPPRSDGRDSEPPIDGGPPRVVQLSAGDHFTCARRSDGRVKCWGQNNAGELGLGDTRARGNDPDEMGTNLPEVDLGAPALSIASGHRHSCAVLEGNVLKCWGGNARGKLGLGDSLARGDGPGEMGANLPAVPLPQPAHEVAVGEDHTCARYENGGVVCWGDAAFGQTGRRSTTGIGNDPGEVAALVPIDLAFAQATVAIAAGARHTCALSEQGYVTCWGLGNAGQLGRGNTLTVGDDDGDQLVTVPIGGNAVGVSAGNSSSCAAFANGSITCWGDGGSGRLGLDGTANRGDGPGDLPLPAIAFPASVTQVVPSRLAHTCAIADQKAYCWGFGAVGQLGRDSTLQIGDSSGEMALLMQQPIALAGPVAQVVAGQYHTCALLVDGRVQCWGSSFAGQLGMGHVLTVGDEPGEMAALGFVDLGW